jgi:DNA polymerase-3 subunit gamma/tau
MSYQVLARKWRPKRFVEMVGQEHVLKALVNALDDDRLHHAYLFTGTRGVGKTSIARLFAKSLNCEQGVSSEPCGQCSACTEIAEGRFVDLIEVDAASRTKVEDTRELLENVQYAPTQGRYKVYLIDEVHMLSTHSFNALLKTLEEPPPHIKFLLATTDPQKLPVTILSRCLQFNLKNLAAEHIVEHLSFVLGEESIQADEAALWLLARAAEGSMRDALSLTDQAIAFGAGSITDDNVRAMLGTIDHRVVFELLNALAESDGAKLVQLVASMSEFAPDYAGVLAEMISILHRIALAQVVPDAIDNALGDKAQVVDLAARMRAEEVQLYYQIALTGRKDLPMVPQPREGLQMTLLRMLAFRPADQRPINAAPVVESAAVSTPIAPAPAPAPAPAESAPALRAEPPAPTHSAPEPSVVDRPPVSSNEPPPWDEEPMPVDAYGDEASKKPETDVPVTAAPDADAVGSASVTDSQGSVAEDSQESFEEADVAEESEQDSEQDALPEVEADTADLKAATDTSSINLSSGLAPEPATSLAALQLPHWLRLVEALGLSGMTESLARSLSLESISGNKLALHYTREQEALLNDVHKARISEALQGYFAEPLAIEFVLGEQLQETPQLYRQRRDRERRAAALAHLQADPAVQQIIETFSAEILSDSVEPLNIE